METVIISPKFQVVLPKTARNALGLKIDIHIEREEDCL